ncbi:hypothetical protein RFI_13259 [Reticulomyxa filosa]|uniref:Uncharacterized protein n=1 Tax=Reticulomyxa filosa TaxID=46433 RepID=X6ND70_RETFI|nr:hypothetical protein RFI_13259 [Reticulomyxa filosa]|eukprot:ETO23901.1 hypothetical protein RFI_13259 [Reticulomyxa filosa]
MAQRKTNTEYDCLFVLLLVGDSGVGKSCLLLRFTEDTFSDNMINTIGVDFKTKTINVDDKVIKLQLWFFFLQKKKKKKGKNLLQICTSKNFFFFFFYVTKKNVGNKIVYDVTKADTFDSVSNWLHEIERNAPETVCKLLVGNKSDKDEQHSRQVPREKGENLALEHRVPFVETSAKNTDNVSRMFETMARLILEKWSQRNTYTTTSNELSKINIQPTTQNSTKDNGCWC